MKRTNEETAQIKSYIVIKYGSQQKAYSMMMNWSLVRPNKMTVDEFNMLNEFFALR